MLTLYNYYKVLLNSVLETIYKTLYPLNYKLYI